MYILTYRRHKLAFLSIVYSDGNPNNHRSMLVGFDQSPFVCTFCIALLPRCVEDDAEVGRGSREG